MAMVVAWVAGALAQPRTVTGVVTSSEDGSTLPQLSVALKGSTQGVVTDLDGHYRITVPGPEAVLQFVYMGMETQEITVGDRTEINVVMQPADKAIDQVVVVGYGTGKKISSTVGKVSSVGAQKLEAKPAANAMDALAGQVPGLSILSDSGEPSALSSITLHGSGSLGASSDPLYVLDGIPVAQSTILAMNPSDFERIDILTDASATSIYGSRAANGVIYITTKQGKVAEKATVVARYSFGLSNLASTRYFRQIQGTAEAFDMFEELGTVSPSQLQQLRDRYGDSTFRWYKYRYRDNAPVHNADISVSGGAGRTNYFVSAGYYSSTGLTPMSYYERYNLRANINSKANSWLRLGLNTGLAYDRSRQNPISGGYIEGGLIMTTPPWTRPYKKDGSEYDGSIPNTQLTSNKHYEKNWLSATHRVSLTSTGFVQITPIEGLNIKSQGGLEARLAVTPTRVLPTMVGLNGQGNARENISTVPRFINSNTIEYNFTLAEDHHITPLIGHEFIYSFSKSVFARANELKDSRLMLLGNGNPQRNVVSSGFYELFYNSFFGRVEYDYAGRYFVDASIRDDESSKFGRNNRHALFWSAGAMWRAKEESFLKDLRWLNDLSVKASIGTSGNAAIPARGNQAWTAAYRSLALAGENGIYDGVHGFGITEPGNPNLTWEKQLKFTLGLQFELFDIVKADVSFYHRKTSSMLMEVPKPYTSGYGEILSNVGALTNTGVDLRLDVTAWKDSRGNHVTPYVVLNYNRQRITKLFDGRKYWLLSGEGLAYAVGRPVEYFFPRFYRINPDNGKPEWYLADPDNPTKVQTDPNKITDDWDVANKNAQATGKPRVAPFQGGFGFNLSLWGAYMQCDFNFQLDKWMFSNDRFFFENPMRFPGQVTSKKINSDSYWKKPGDKKKYPSKDVVTWVNFDDRLLENASFMRLKNLTIGYNFPKKWVEKTRFFSSGKVYTSFRNLFTVTKFEGPDPEPDTNVGRGINPNTKQYSFGIELTF